MTVGMCVGVCVGGCGGCREIDVEVFNTFSSEGHQSGKSLDV